MEPFLRRGPLTTPGRHAAAIEALPAEIDALMTVVRGLLVHCDHLDLYGVDESNAPAPSRETLPLEARLDRIFASSGAPLSVPRQHRYREIGTCRDYAVMTCGMLRQKRVPSRVRCGFASYFGEGRWEDHWICEYWRPEQGRWARADAQLDEAHCRHLAILFDTADLPVGAFLTAAEAWRRHRNHGVSAELFGHGDATGEWFLWVNLARDYLALKGRETSAWDTWRETAARPKLLDDADRRRCDDLAALIETAETGHETPAASLRQLEPFWRPEPLASG